MVRPLAKWEIKEIILHKDIEAEFEHEALLEIGKEILEGRFKLKIGKKSPRKQYNDIKEVQERGF